MVSISILQWLLGLNFSRCLRNILDLNRFISIFLSTDKKVHIYWTEKLLFMELNTSLVIKVQESSKLSLFMAHDVDFVSLEKVPLWKLSYFCSLTISFIIVSMSSLFLKFLRTDSIYMNTFLMGNWVLQNVPKLWFLLYRCYDPDMSRYLLSPICGIF